MQKIWKFIVEICVVFLIVFWFTKQPLATAIIVSTMMVLDYLVWIRGGIPMFLAMSLKLKNYREKFKS